MSLARLLTEPVTIERSTVIGRDSLGNDITAWTVVGQPSGRTQALPQSQGGSELLTDRDTVVVVRRLYLPAGTDVTAADRVTAGGVVWTVDGEPDATHTSPLTGIGYVAVTLRRSADV